VCDIIRVNEKRSGLKIVFVALFGNRTAELPNSVSDSHIKVTSFWRQGKESNKEPRLVSSLFGCLGCSLWQEVLIWQGLPWASFRVTDV